MNDDLPVKLCECGCGSSVKNKFVSPAHFLRSSAGKTVRTKEYRQTIKMQSPHPPQLCACGCGGYTSVSERNYPKYGYIKGEPRRFIHNHHRWQKLEDRFWNNVDKSPGQGPNGECWSWTGLRTTLGYGRIMMTYPGGTHRGTKASRIAYELAHGSPPRFTVCHTCDFPPCVRPDHLFDGTQQDNADDMVRKGRSRKGVMHRNARLTEEQVREIRQRYMQGETQARLGQEFGLSHGSIGSIVRRENWVHVQ